jgi:hypothetical protein
MFFQASKKVVWLLCISLLVTCRRPDMPQSKLVDGYHFPVQPGTEEWRRLGSRAEMLAAVQIPAELLAAMPTTALVATVLNYPLYGDLFAYDSHQAGMDAMRRDFNGLSALHGRPDAAVLLLERYQEVDLHTLQDKTVLAEQGEVVIRLTFLELILAQPEILAQLPADKRVSLLQETMVKKNQRAALESYEGYGELDATALLAGRTLQLEGYLRDAGPAVGRFLQNSSRVSGRELALAVDTVFSETLLFLDSHDRP